MMIRSCGRLLGSRGDAALWWGARAVGQSTFAASVVAKWSNRKLAISGVARHRLASAMPTRAAGLRSAKVAGDRALVADRRGGTLLLGLAGVVKSGPHVAVAPLGHSSP